MKLISSSLIILISSICFAGGSGGGGGVRPELMSTAPGINGAGTMLNTPTKGIVDTISNASEIVYFINEQDSRLQFTYGILIDSQWQLQHVEMPKADLMVDSSALKALQNSKDFKSWAEIQ